MRIRSTITAFGTTLALALTLTAASTPAFAAKTNNGDTKPPTTVVDPTDKKPKIEQHKPGSVIDAINTGPKVEVVKPGSVIDAMNPVQPKFKPDIRVTYLELDWNGNGKNYRFRVENIGIETANNIGVSSEVRRSSHGLSENIGVIEYGGHAPFGPLATGEYRDITVDCLPKPNYSCDSASLHASVEGDINPNNNGAGGN